MLNKINTRINRRAGKALSLLAAIFITSAPLAAQQAPQAQGQSGQAPQMSSEMKEAQQSMQEINQQLQVAQEKAMEREDIQKVIAENQAVMKEEAIKQQPDKEEEVKKFFSVRDKLRNMENPGQSEEAQEMVQELQSLQGEIGSALQQAAQNEKVIESQQQTQEVVLDAMEEADSNVPELMDKRESIMQKIQKAQAKQRPEQQGQGGNSTRQAPGE